MLSGNHENETTLRLLYYPPIIRDDGNKCEVTKGKCKYSQQKCCSGDNLEQLLKNAEDAEKGDENDANDTEAKSKEPRAKEACVTRCGAHCDYGTFTLLSQDSEGGLEVGILYLYHRSFSICFLAFILMELCVPKM